MYTFLYNEDNHTYFDSYTGIKINSGADFDRFWLGYYNSIKKSKESPLDCLAMELEDYEAMRFDRIYGVWKDEPFLGIAPDDETIKTLRSFRRLANRISEKAELPDDDLEHYLFKADITLIDHYLGDKRPKDRTPITGDDLHYFDVHWMLRWLEYFRDDHDLDEYCRLQLLEGADITPIWYKKVEKFRFKGDVTAMMGEPRHQYPEKEMLEDIEWWANIYEDNLKKQLSKYKKSEIPEHLKEEQKLFKTYRSQMAKMLSYYAPSPNPKI